jgi:hypothetical protein
MGRSWDTGPILNRLKTRKKIGYAEIYHEIMSDLIQESPAHRWGEKTMIRWTYIPKFLEMFPKGHALHVLRDPRDVLSSFKRVTNEPGLRYLDAVFTTLHSMSWAATMGNRLSTKRYRVVKYEDLVQHPENTVSAICSFLGIPYESKMLDCTRFKDRGGKQWQANTAYDEPLSGVQPSSIGKFSDNLSPPEIFLVEMVTRNVLTHAGYKLTGIWLNSDQWQYLYQMLSDKFVNSRFKVWLKTNDGIESYPSPPPEVQRDKGLEVIDVLRNY